MAATAAPTTGGSGPGSSPSADVDGERQRRRGGDARARGRVSAAIDVGVDVTTRPCARLARPRASPPMSRWIPAAAAGCVRARVGRTREHGESCRDRALPCPVRKGGTLFSTVAVTEDLGLAEFDQGRPLGVAVAVRGDVDGAQFIGSSTVRAHGVQEDPCPLAACQPTFRKG